MATAYRHMGLGSPVQVMHFISQREHEIRKALQDWEAEHEMWAKVDQRPALSDGVRGYLRARRGELADAILTVQREQAILQELHAAFQPCAACKGLGVYLMQYDQDDIRHLTCETCNGSGTRA